MLYGGGEAVQLHTFLISVSDGGEYLKMPWLLNFQGKEPRYPLNMGLGGPPSRSGRLGGKKYPYP